jgi:hypothetical protein
VLTDQQHQYIGAIQRELKVSSTTPIQLNMVYSFSWSGAETETHVFKMAAYFKDKRTSITTMRAINRAFAIFQTFSLPTTLKNNNN